MAFMRKIKSKLTPLTTPLTPSAHKQHWKRACLSLTIRLCVAIFGFLTACASGHAVADGAFKRVEISQRNAQAKPKLAADIWRAIVKKEFGDAGIAKDMGLDARGMSIGQADLNDDGQPDALVVLDNTYSCGSNGCIVHAVVSHGADWAVYSTCGNVQVANGLSVLSKKTNGLRDLRAGDVELTFDGILYCNLHKGERR